MRPGRKFKEPPWNAADVIETLAADGWSMLGIARKLGICRDTLRRWIEENPALNEAIQTGREKERWELHNSLFRAATERGNVIAAMFLLKARHKYFEYDRSIGKTDDSERTSFLAELAKILPK